MKCPHCGLPCEPEELERSDAFPADEVEAAKALSANHQDDMSAYEYFCCCILSLETESSWPTSQVSPDAVIRVRGLMVEFSREIAEWKEGA